MDRETCSKYTAEAFLALAAGDIGGWRAWAMRRHTTTCPACASAWTEVQTLFGSARRLADDLPSHGVLRESIWNALPTGMQPALGHTARFPIRRIALGGVAAAAVIGGAAILLILPGTPTHPTVAFAQVEEAMREVKTARWIETAYTLFDDAERYRFSEEVWVRTDPPGIARRLIKDSVKGPIQPPDDHQVQNDEGEISYRAKANRYTITHFPNGSGGGLQRRAQQMLLQNLHPPDPQAPEERGKPIGRPRVPGYLSEWHVDTVTEDGRTLTRFRRRLTPGVNRTGVNAGHFEPTTYTVLADPQTRRVVRAEQRVDEGTISFPPPGPNVIPAYTRPGQDPHRPLTARMTQVTITENFRYDEEPPAGIFDLTPPPGARVEVKDWRSNPVALTPALRRVLQGTIDRANDAWRRSDFDAFSREWDFGYLAAQPNTEKTYRSEAWCRRSWEYWVRAQRGAWKIWESHIESVQGVRYLYYVEKSLPPEDPDVLQAIVVLRTRDQRGKEQRKERWVFLRHTPGGGYRIINWNW